LFSAEVIPIVETQVKERLTGAVILVALIVLLVPELLTGGPGKEAPSSGTAAGSAEPAVRTYDIDLVEGGVSAQVPQATDADLSARALKKPEAVVSQSSTTETELKAPPAAVPSEAQATGPVVASKLAPADESDSASAPAPPAVVMQAPKVEQKPAARSETKLAVARPSGTSSASGWVVQLGSFASRDNAQRLAKQLKGKGFDAFVLGGGGSSGKLYRVRVGPEPNRAAADALAKKLRAAGFKGGAVVSHP
jgi:DedD protein